MDTIQKTVDSVVTNIVEQVAAHRGIDPVRLTPPLFQSIDPDALGSVLACGDGRTPITVSFRYADTDVTVTSDGDISVELSELGVSATGAR